MTPFQKLVLQLLAAILNRVSSSHRYEDEERLLRRARSMSED